MSRLLLGLVLFLGSHSVRIYAENWRQRQITRFGKNLWKAGYSIVSLIGFVFIIQGFGAARQQSIFVWTPPASMLHVNALFVLIAFILITAAYVPRNHFKAWLHHPMTLGIQAWAFGHLLASGRLASIVLFGSFLVWAILSFNAARQRDHVNPPTYPGGHLIGTVATLIIGTGLWAAFLLRLHTLLIGVPLLLL